MTCIKMENVTKKINGSTVLDGISATMESGYVYGFKGINGSGKTMLMRAIIGLVRITSGEILIDDKRLGRDIEFPESIGFLIENPAFLDRYDGFRNLKLIAGMKGIASEARVREVLARVDLEAAGKKKYKKYSLGMKQRLGIAAAILERPDILILDEPTNALDASGVELVKTIVLEERERGALVILSSHDKALLEELADEVFELSEGKIMSVSHPKQSAVE